MHNRVIYIKTKLKHSCNINRTSDYIWISQISCWVSYIKQINLKHCFHYKTLLTYSTWIVHITCWWSSWCSGGMWFFRLWLCWCATLSSCRVTSNTQVMSHMNVLQAVSTTAAAALAWVWFLLHWGIQKSHQAHHCCNVAMILWLCGTWRASVMLSLIHIWRCRRRG